MPARVQKGPRMETSARHTPKARTCDRICRSARTQSCHKTKVVSQDKVGTIVLLWLSYFAVFAIPVLLQGYLSWKGQFLTPSQMQQQGVATGLPFIAHTAMWSDASLLAALMATIIYLYGPQWDSGQFCIALGIGIIGSALMHWGFYVNSFFEQAHVRNGMLTDAGIIHFMYMAIGLAITILFYTCTKGLSVTSVTVVSLLLVTHVVIGTLVPLKIWARITHPTWYPEQLSVDRPTVCTILGVGAAVCAASFWAVRF
jgi:hypothetical protein